MAVAIVVLAGLNKTKFSPSRMMDGSAEGAADADGSSGRTMQGWGREARIRIARTREHLVYQRVIVTPAMPDVAPNRLHISRHYG